MNKYKNLALNTFIVGLGTFGSKLLVFLLMPLYTRVLSTNDYGIVDIVVQTSNLLVPIISVGITDAVIRFGLDSSFNKRDVFTTGVVTILCGFGIFLLFAPLLHQLDFLSGYSFMVYLYVFMSSMRLLCTRFVRSRELIRLFALDGFLSTLTTILLTVLFLVGFKWGIIGYLLATILSDFISILFLTVVARLHRFLRLSDVHKSTVKAMFKYAIPLIPSTIFWWITNVSDRYIVTAMLGAAANGLYAISYKVPTVINLVSNIFSEAWQISAISEGSKQDRDRFFSNVFNAYQSLIFPAASGIILCSKFITKILVSESFYPSWKYIPFLVMATSFSCLVNFLGSIYMVEKKSMLTFITSAIGAGTNIVLNILLIPMVGINGAAFATFFSCFLIFVIRAINTRKYICIHFNVLKVSLNTLVILAQSVIMILEVKNWLLLEVILTAFVIVINFKMILQNISRILVRKKV